jgi:hypothetical protein
MLVHRSILLINISMYWQIELRAPFEFEHNQLTTQYHIKESHARKMLEDCLRLLPPFLIFLGWFQRYYITYRRHKMWEYVISMSLIFWNLKLQVEFKPLLLQMSKEGNELHFQYIWFEKGKEEIFSLVESRTHNCWTAMW